MAKTKEKQKDDGAKIRLPEPRLKSIYREKVAPELMKQFGFTSIMQVPKIEKIIVNMGTGNEEKDLENSMRDMAVITGQRPVATRAKKSVSNFKIREGMKVGCRVTLRSDNALHFFDRLCTVALPRIRDFQGLNPKSFDGRGNYSLGLKEQLVFTEINYDSFDKIRGMDITICTTAQNDEVAYAFLKAMGLPLREK